MVSPEAQAPQVEQAVLLQRSVCLVMKGVACWHGNMQSVRLRQIKSHACSAGRSGVVKRCHTLEMVPFSSRRLLSGSLYSR